MSVMVRRCLLLVLSVAPVVLFSESATRWSDIIASPFTSVWVAGAIVFVGYIAYAAASTFSRITATGLSIAWAVVLFIGLLGMAGGIPSDDWSEAPPPPIPGALDGSDRLLRNYLWYMAAVGIGLFIAVRRGRARWDV